MTENVQVHHATVFDDRTRHVARVYAEALLAAADKRQQITEVLEELEVLSNDVVREPAIRAFFAGAVISRERKREALRRAFEGKVNDLLYHFLQVLNNHDRLSVFRAVVVALRDMYERRSGRMRVAVRSAAPLADDQQERLRQELRDKFGREPILSVGVDPDLLGGLVVRVDDWVYDGSVQARLQRIQNQLIERSSYVPSH